MISRTLIVTTAVVVAGMLAGCSAAPSPASTGQTPQSSPKPAEAEVEPSPAPTPEASASEDCSVSAWIEIGRMGAELTGKLEDRGAREFAEGTAGFDDDGNIVSYTVAPGDAPLAIGERFCFESMGVVKTLNHTRTIQPGQVLRLDPDPDAPWVPYFNPPDAPAGFEQIPYQLAIEAMGAAADAGDVDAMRAIWADELSGMFNTQADIDMIARALDAGDLDELRQMFS